MQVRQVPPELFQQAFEQAAVGQGLIGMDARWVAVNAALCRMLGYEEEQLTRMTWSQVTHPDDVAADKAQIKRMLAGEIAAYSIRKRCIRSDGTVVEMQVQITKGVANDGSLRFFFVQLLDLPRALAEEQAREQQEKIRLLVENVSDGFIGMDQDGRITEWNRQAERILQWTAQEAIGRRMAPMLVPERYRDMHEQGMRRFLDTETRTIMDKPVELPLVRKDGAELQAEMTIGAIKHHDRYHFATFVRDVSERKALEQQLQHQATRDHLTGLANRFEFMRRLAEAMGPAQRRACDGRYALMFIDLDGFKQVNDVHGHQAGDQLLQAFAAGLQASVRRADLVARLAGDEFVVLVNCGDDARRDAGVVAHKVLAVARGMGREGTPVSASIGIALQDGQLTPDEFLQQGDRAMYQAKRAGKNQIAFA